MKQSSNQKNKNSYQKNNTLNNKAELENDEQTLNEVSNNNTKKLSKKFKKFEKTSNEMTVSIVSMVNDLKGGSSNENVYKIDFDDDRCSYGSNLYDCLRECSAEADKRVE